MATCRAVIGEGLRALKALGLGDEPSVDELAAGVEALGALILEIHDGRGPMLDVDVSTDVTPSENQRVRVQAGASIAVTLPNAIPIFNTPDPYDYGFNASSAAPPVGTTGPADGVQYRQPRDGTRIEVVGTTQALYFYRSDLNAWMAATGLTADSELPFNDRYASALAALLAERLMESLPGVGEPTPGLARRIARGRAALLLQTGTMHDPVAASYL
jgi:hypothetical protein